MTTNANRNTGHVTNHEKLSSFLEKHLRTLLFSVTGLLAVALVIVGFILFKDYKANTELRAYESLSSEFEDNLIAISKKYQPVDGQEQTDEAAAKQKQEVAAESIAHAQKIVALAEKSHWGYMSENGLYIAAGFYFSEKDYKAALDLYLKSSDKVNGKVMKMLALQQAAICYEWLNNNDKAMEIYQTLEKKYSKSEYLDRIYYDLGRIYQVKGDNVKAAEYFSKVIKNYATSVFAKKSQERILLLGSK